MTTLFKPAFKALNDELTLAGKSLSIGDFTFAHDVLDMLNNNNNEIERFSKNPKQYIEAAGFAIPSGIEGIYYIDKTGTVHPHPHDKPSSGQGARVVAEVYKEPGILGFCIICMGCINNSVA